MACGILRGISQNLKVRFSFGRIFLLEPPFVCNRLLLHILNIDGAADRVISRELILGALAEQYGREQVGELHGVVNAAVQSKTADWIIHVS